MTLVELWSNNSNKYFFTNTDCCLYLSGNKNIKPVPEGKYVIIISGVVAIDRNGKVVLLSDDPIDEIGEKFWKAITDNFPIILNN